METNLRVNGGFFLFRKEIFDYMRPGEELVQEPFGRLIQADELLAYEHDGFTASMDTFKDKQHFDELYAKGKAPWEVWRRDMRSYQPAFEAYRPPAPVEQRPADLKPGVRYSGSEGFLSSVRFPPGETPSGVRWG
jgi:NDP-sugar pyrophosphorylase family protein